VKKGSTCLSVKKRRWCRGDEDAKETGALDDGGSGSSPRAVPVFAANGAHSDGLRFPASLLSSFSSSTGERAVWSGDEPLSQLGLGTPGGAMAAYL
jgi:hypothetical protein